MHLPRKLHKIPLPLLEKRDSTLHQTAHSFQAQMGPTNAITQISPETCNQSGIARHDARFFPVRRFNTSLARRSCLAKAANPWPARCSLGEGLSVQKFPNAF